MLLYTHVAQTYFLLGPADDPYPPPLDSYLAQIKNDIGAEVKWQEVSEDVYFNFATAGDWMRTSAPQLESVINAGVMGIFCYV